MILTRNDLRKELLSAVGQAVFIAAAFWFRSEFESYVGPTATSWALYILLFLYPLSLVRVICGWVDVVGWERAERKRKQEDEHEVVRLENERKQEQAEYDAFIKWARLNPRTVERLLSIVELEQFDDAERLSWMRERREAEGPNPLTDLPRLYEWLKARRELQKFGIDPPLPPL